MGEAPQPGPFGFGSFDLGEVLRLIRSEGPLNFEVARQVALWVAGQAEAPGPPEPRDLELLVELARVARMHVEEATGLRVPGGLDARVVQRSDWALETLEGLRPVLARLAEQLATRGEPSEGAGGVGEAGGFGGSGGAELDAAGLLAAVAPVLLGLQSGFMVGHLALRTLSRYEMPLPLDIPPAVAFVGPNVVRFEKDWQLPREDFGFYLALHETAHAAVLAVEWVRRRVLELGLEYVSAFDVDPHSVEEHLTRFNPADPSTLEFAVTDPGEFLDAIRSPAQRELLARITAVTSVVAGYVDVVMEQVGRPLIPSFGRIREACHRNRVERGEASRFLGALLGFELTRADYESAASFCRGVVERAGLAGLGRLWEGERMLPTPAEREAPGLWLERINLPVE